MDGMLQGLVCLSLRPEMQLIARSGEAQRWPAARRDGGATGTDARPRATRRGRSGGDGVHGHRGLDAASRQVTSGRQEIEAQTEMTGWGFALLLAAGLMHAGGGCGEAAPVVGSWWPSMPCCSSPALGWQPWSSGKKGWRKKMKCGVVRQ